MKIAVDISQIAYPGSGVSRFTEGFVRAICEFGTDHSWTFFFSSLRNSLNPEIKKLIKDKGHSLIVSKIPPTLLAFIWNQLHFFPIDQIVGSQDWIITSDWTEPPSKARKATIVHDLVYLKYPDTLDPLIKRTQEQRLKRVQKESSIIFADSDSTLLDLVSLLGINRNKITVNYPGLSLESTNSKTPRKKVILTVGKLEPRKNLERLVHAFNLLEDKDIELWIAGMHGWGNVKIVQNPRIKLLGYVTEEKLKELYETCLIFTLPSIYEGFGYPILEAMAHGAPVATSNTSSLREVAGNAAHFFDPKDERDIARALSELIESKKLRDTLIKNGFQRVKNFTWKKYYETLINTLEKYS